jgi:tetratricopeptide (TPR) repeat protein
MPRQAIYAPRVRAPRVVSASLLGVACLALSAGCQPVRPLTAVRFTCDDARAREHQTLTCPARGGPAWTEVTSPHFRLWTDLPSKCARAAMIEYEQDYAALRDIAFPFDIEPAGRTTLVLFSRAQDQDRLLRDAMAAGMFSRSNSPWGEPTMAVIRWWQLEEARTTFMHELTHHFVRFYYGQVPTWMNEGLAEFYETLDVTNGWAEMGATHRRRSPRPTRWELLIPSSKAVRPDDLTGAHRFTLMASTLPSVPQLDAMGGAEFYGFRASGEHARGETMARNYTASWVYVHFLKTGPPRYQKAFDDYLRRVAAGASHRAAWTAAFQGISHAEIDAAIQERFEDENNPGLRTEYEHPKPPPMSERVMSDAEVHVAWTKVRAKSQRDRIGEDLVDVEEALAREPNNAAAIFARARVHLGAGRLADAEVDARRAMQLQPDELRYVEGLVAIYQAMDRKSASPSWERLEPLLAKLSSPAASSSALNTFAWIAALRGRPDQGLEASKRSIQKDPACWACYDTLAALLYQKDDVEAALGAQQLAANLLPERQQVGSVLQRLKQYQGVVAAKQAARDPAWKPPPLDLRSWE